MIAIELRPYQLDAVNRLREALRQHRRVCFQLPTGGGKTIVFAYIARGVCTRGRAALILVHRCELIRQTLDKLASFGVEAGVIANGWPADPERQMQVASVQTLARRLDQAPEADLVILDEAHHAVAATWSAVLERYQDKRVLGVTATPEGLDGKGQIGRALRPKSDGSRAIVLDHAGNCCRHGHPAERRMWSLEGREAREAAEQEEREREEQLARSPDEQADFVEETDGQLVPLTSGEFDRSYLRDMSLRQALRLCVTEADVRMLGRLRGYKPGWAWHILREREARNAA